MGAQQKQAEKKRLAHGEAYGPWQFTGENTGRRLTYVAPAGAKCRYCDVDALGCVKCGDGYSVNVDCYKTQEAVQHAVAHLRRKVWQSDIAARTLADALALAIKA
jgi:hypothetical protein